MRRLNSLGLYSKGAEKASELPEGSFPAQQLIASLLNKGGISKDELLNAGVVDEDNKPHPDWVKRGKISKQDLIEHLHGSVPQISEITHHPDVKPEINALMRSIKALHNTISFDEVDSPERLEKEKILNERIDRLNKLQEINDNIIPAKFQDFTLPYQKNYREVLLKYESNPPPISEKKYYDLADKAEQERLTDAENDQMKAYTDWKNNNQNKPRTEYKSSHWKTPDVLAHIRMSDRLGPRDEKILHVEELQSDWGQEGRKEGFWSVNNKKFNDLLKKKDAAKVGSPEYVAAQNELNEFSKTTGVGLPDAPYVTKTAAWTDLALKRVMHEAAKGGYDHIVWTPGQQHANRYNLRNSVDRIAYDPEEKEFSYVPKDGSGWQSHDNPIEPHELGKLIGEDAAKQLLATPRNKLSGNHTLETPNMEFGGEGMKAYYDKMVPTRLQKLAQEHDPKAKVAPSQFTLPPDTERGDPDEPIKPLGLTITPQMRQSILQGQSAFADGGAVNEDEDGITAYHGSPHDFEQFDTSKIGTGEGAQAYGHGLYFAEREPIAQWYKETLSNSETPYHGKVERVMQKLMDAGVSPMDSEIMSSLAWEGGFDPEKNNIHEFFKSDDEDDDDYSHHLKNPKVVEAIHEYTRRPTPRMYEVAIDAHPDHFMDYNKPFAEQSEYVKERAQKAFNKKLGPNWYEHNEREGTGIYDVLDHLHHLNMEPQHLSKMLNDEGIAGIKYLDSDSMHVDKPGRKLNYVVFDHDRVKIKRKYARGGVVG